MYHHSNKIYKATSCGILLLLLFISSSYFSSINKFFFCLLKHHLSVACSVDNFDILNKMIKSSLGSSFICVAGSC